LRFCMSCCGLLCVNNTYNAVKTAAPAPNKLINKFTTASLFLSSESVLESTGGISDGRGVEVMDVVTDGEADGVCVLGVEVVGVGVVVGG
jgi:hypothetical protein